MIRNRFVPRSGGLMGIGPGCCLFFVVPVVLLVAAAVLLLSIALANRSLGTKPTAPPTATPRSGRIAEWDWDDWDDEGRDLEPVRPWRGGTAIPEAGTVKCMVIMFLTALAYGFGFVVMIFAAQDMGFRRRDEMQLIALLLDLPVAGVALTVLLALFLPTNLWRAAMVAFIYGLLILAFVLFVGVGVFGLAFVFR